MAFGWSVIIKAVVTTTRGGANATIRGGSAMIAVENAAQLPPDSTKNALVMGHAIRPGEHVSALAVGLDPTVI